MAKITYYISTLQLQVLHNYKVGGHLVGETEQHLLHQISCAGAVAQIIVINASFSNTHAYSEMYASQLACMACTQMTSL